jgi:hypothetical protein
MRLRSEGLRVVCLRDAFVHHFDKTSFGHLVLSGQYGEILEQNKREFAEKWEAPWLPYERRATAVYEATVDRIRAVVEATVPEGATLAVISRGDDELLQLGRRNAWHCPSEESGIYAGYHPPNGAVACAEIQRLRCAGADYLLIPRPSLWWLMYYPELAEALRERAITLITDESCQIYLLGSLEPIARADELTTVDGNRQG